MPYKGAAQSVTDLIAGQTHFTIDGMVILIPQVKAGKLRALAVARPERWPELPDVPTLVESGYPDFTIDAWTGVMAPNGTPRADRREAQRRHQRGLKTDGDQDRARPLQRAAKASTPQEFEAFLKDQLPKWASMVKLAGARVNKQAEYGQDVDSTTKAVMRPRLKIDRRIATQHKSRRRTILALAVLGAFGNSQAAIGCKMPRNRMIKRHRAQYRCAGGNADVFGRVTAELHAAGPEGELWSRNRQSAAASMRRQHHGRPPHGGLPTCTSNRGWRSGGMIREFASRAASSPASKPASAVDVAHHRGEALAATRWFPARCTRRSPTCRMHGTNLVPSATTFRSRCHHHSTIEAAHHRRCGMPRR